MPSTINAQTTPFAAIVATADNTGSLALQTANVTALSINSSQVVSLTNALPLASGGTNATNASDARTNLGLVLGVSANNVPQFDSSGWLVLGSGWKVKESAGVLYFAVGSTNYMKLDTSGNLTVTGNVTAYGTV